jgi:magnesium transporter
MKSFFKIKEGAIVECVQDEASVVIYSELDEATKQLIVDDIGITLHDIDSALDPDEISRVEYTPEYTYIIWKYHP